jgi:two-component system chemotaxis response regulator CheB
MIRCVVADDSRVFRAILRTILARAPGVEVVGEAADGDQAVEKVLSLRPDVVTLDVRMPGRDGLGAIEEIMRVAPTPIIVVSAEAGPERQETSFRALQLGAIEVLPKPRSDLPGRFERDAEAIRLAVRGVAGLQLVTRHRRRASPDARVPQARTPAPGVQPAPPPVRPSVVAAPRGAQILGIAASTGGPAAIARILSALPARYPLPILVVQHIAPGFESGLVHWLSGETALAVKLAVHGEGIRAGTVYVAPDGLHMGAAKDRIWLGDAPAIRGFRPSGTVLFESLAREYGALAAGLILSGMGDDGAGGLRALRDRGAWTAAQGPNSSAVFGMPRAAIALGAAVETLELDDVPAALLRIARPAERA